ncbi:hypothetical protein TRFO_02789 [Tritrichomonas foetus]|uniref:SH3 domain-containing protein n=1 Tax=Tritrichomonas foetus TaxID=1144522 RepID=A0A1J4L0S9_9EUKA|nr:hypothetical protein TRFO_02789 [Tritrichomonas foetus]|eukprot:OHT15485.1 hypothetical protein TRFO_02789 [Tritrichomonas foetus]
MNQKYAFYDQGLKSMSNTFKKNNLILSSVYELSAIVGTRIDQVLEHLVKLDGVAVSHSMRRDSGQFKSCFSEHWRILANAILNPSDNLHYLSRALNTYCLDYLKEVALEYKKRSAELESRGKDVVRQFRISNRANQNAYSAYSDAGKALEEGFAVNSPKLPHLRDNFEKAQKEAVKMHNENNIQRAVVCTLFEQIYNDFEILEKWRSEKIENCLKIIADKMGELAILFNTSAEQIDKFTTAMDPELDIKPLQNLPKIKCECVSDFQVASVSPFATSFLDLQTSFRKYILKGAKIGLVIKEYKGNFEELTVAKDEIIAVLERVDNRFKCADINDCIGLIPESYIKVL